MRIAVAGSTGAVGSHAVQLATLGGHDVVQISRKMGVDARTGVGLLDALEGVDVIIDTTNTTTTSRAKATSFFTEVTQRLQSAGSAQGASRLVTLSILEVDKVPGFGYYEAKLAHEIAAKTGPLSATIVRAAQFFEFPSQLLSRGSLGPFAFVPSMRIQPVSARAIAQALVDEATSGGDQESVVELAGPNVEELTSLARTIVRSRRRRTVVVPVRIPGQAGKALRGGSLLASPTTRIVGPSFQEWLDGDGAVSLKD